MSDQCRPDVGRSLLNFVVSQHWVSSQPVDIQLHKLARHMAEPTPEAEQPTCLVCKLCSRALPESAPGRYRGISWTCVQALLKSGDNAVPTYRRH